MDELGQNTKVSQYIAIANKIFLCFKFSSLLLFFEIECSQQREGFTKGEMTERNFYKTDFQKRGNDRKRFLQRDLEKKKWQKEIFT